jgi:hypothetical protein
MTPTLSDAGGAHQAPARRVLSDTALPRLLDDDVLARAYGLVLPAGAATA